MNGTVDVLTMELVKNANSSGTTAAVPLAQIYSMVSLLKNDWCRRIEEDLLRARNTIH